MTSEKSNIVGKKPNIFEAIPLIIADIGAVGKDKKNQQQGFMYRGIDDVMNAISPVIAKYGVFVVPEILEESRNERATKSGGINFIVYLRIKFTFFASDGSSISAVTIGEAMDTADKGSNKAMAIAFKYACFQVFCIPTEEMKDPDAETPEPSVKESTKIQPLNPQKQDQPKVDERAAIIMKIDKLVYPERTPEGKGNADGFCYEIYLNELKAYMSLNKNIKKLSDLNLNQLKDMLQKMDLPEVLR